MQCITYLWYNLTLCITVSLLHCSRLHLLHQNKSLMHWHGPTAEGTRASLIGDMAFTTTSFNTHLLVWSFWTANQIKRQKKTNTLVMCYGKWRWASREGWRLHKQVDCSVSQKSEWSLVLKFYSNTSKFIKRQPWILVHAYLVQHPWT